MMNLVKKKLRLNNGEDIAYLEVGEGPNILILVHGNVSSCVFYEPLLARLPSGYKAYAPDLRGFGDSSYHNSFDSLRELADDLFDFVSILGIRSFTLAGWSNGGGVSLSFAARYGAMVRDLILIESCSHKGYPIYRKNAVGAPNGEFYKTKAEMAKDPFQVAPAVTAQQEGNSAYLDKLYAAGIYVLKKPSHEDNKILLSEIMKQRNLVDVDWAISNFNISHEFNGYTHGDKTVDNINMPVLSFWADHDAVVSRDMVVSTVEAIGKNARMVTLPNCGHSPFIDCPDLIAEHIFAFIESH